MSGPFEEGFANCKAAFGYREVEQRHKPRILPCRRGGTGYRARHDLDEVLIAPVMEVAEETVVPIVLPADEIYRVYGGVFQVGSPWPNPQ